MNSPLHHLYWLLGEQELSAGGLALIPLLVFHRATHALECFLKAVPYAQLYLKIVLGIARGVRPHLVLTVCGEESGSFDGKFL